MNYQGFMQRQQSASSLPPYNSSEADFRQRMNDWWDEEFTTCIITNNCSWVFTMKLK